MHRRYKQEIAFFLLVLLVLGLWYFGRGIPFSSDLIRQRLEQIPLVYRGIGYVVLYVVVTFFLIFSKDVFWVVGALYFGAVFSTVLIWVAEVINCGVLFYLSRFLGRAFVRKRMQTKYEHLDERLGSTGFIWLFVFRAAPVIPYRFLDLAVGLTSIPFRRYLLAVVLGTPVKTFFIQYVLASLDVAALRDPSRMVVFMTQHREVMFAGVVYVALMFAALFKIRLTARQTRKG
jgi:uncharacterized membrane protein YdjX (TVP38/TMEM64 family)